MALPNDSTNDVALFSGGSDAVALASVWVDDVLLRPKTTDEARSVKTSLITHDNDISAHTERMNIMQDDINTRAYQTDLDNVSTRLTDTRRIADFNSSTLNTLYDPHTKVVTGTGFKVLTSGNNVAGIMAGSADGVEFQTAGGSGYVNITADDVRVPVMNGGNTGYVTMKEMNSLLEDTKAEKDELRSDFDALKETFDSVVNIDNESGRNIYTDNLVTQTATVDGTLTIEKL